MTIANINYQSIIIFRKSAAKMRHTANSNNYALKQID